MTPEHDCAGGAEEGGRGLWRSVISLQRRSGICSEVIAGDQEAIAGDQNDDPKQSPISDTEHRVFTSM
jgi:hypothetical protein